MIVWEKKIFRQIILNSKAILRIMDHHASHGIHNETIAKMMANFMRRIGVQIHTNGATSASSVNMVLTL